MLSVRDILQPENVSYTDSIWTWAAAHMLHNGADWQITTITDTAPIEITFLSKGDALSDYLISGNTVQNGTPAPSDPVPVQGCGEWDATAQQYKIPITCGGVTTTIHLGNVQTTMKIKKLVFDGNENWDYVPSSGVNRFRTRLLSNAAITEVTSTHFKYEFANAYGNVFINSTLVEITFCYNLFSVNDWKSYLAAQYSAGTPVTIWYVLETPETTTLNEPLQKIGDYADTITMAQAGVTLPTTAGTNTLTVGTTVQPSSMSITGRIREAGV